MGVYRGHPATPNEFFLFVPHYPRRTRAGQVDIKKVLLSAWAEAGPPKRRAEADPNQRRLEQPRRPSSRALRQTLARSCAGKAETASPKPISVAPSGCGLQREPVSSRSALWKARNTLPPSLRKPYWNRPVKCYHKLPLLA